MKSTITIGLDDDQYDGIIQHLFQSDGCEDAAFGFCTFHKGHFVCEDWFAVKESTSCVARSAYYLELGDEVRSRVIKQAHDLQASIIEFHSHRTSWQARFSPSDFSGFDEFVPHAWWRLNSRPYAAVVFAESSFDALAWIENPQTPRPVSAMTVRGRELHPTGLSLKKRFNREQ